MKTMKAKDLRRLAEAGAAPGLQGEHLLDISRVL